MFKTHWESFQKAIGLDDKDVPTAVVENVRCAFYSGAYCFVMEGRQAQLTSDQEAAALAVRDMIEELDAFREELRAQALQSRESKAKVSAEV